MAGGKGGVGVTTIAAALADGFSAKRSCALLDLDAETQDLSRFLQARPFLNENLQLLFDRARPITRETVEQCLITLWDRNCVCIPPPPDSEALHDSNSGYSRTLLSFLEVLDSMYEFVIVDAGGARGSLLRSILRAADALLFVVNNDPASLYASVDRLAQYRSWLAPEAQLILVENAPLRRGLPHAFLLREFQSAAELSTRDRFYTIPASPSGARWPASGGTLYSCSKRNVVRALQQLNTALEPESAACDDRGFLSAAARFFKRDDRPDVRQLEAYLAKTALLNPPERGGRKNNEDLNESAVPALFSGADIGSCKTI